MNISESIINTIKTWIQYLENENYQYVKSRSSYEKKDSISSYISINVTTPNAGLYYSIAFYYGVLHHQVEDILSKIDKREINKYARTMYQYSVNDTKNKFPELHEDNCWFLAKKENINPFRDKVITFINRIALPRIESWKDLMTIRTQLEKRIRNNIILDPFEQIIGIDYILNDKRHAEEYIRTFEENNRKMDKGYRDKAAKFFQKCLESNLDFFNGMKTTLLLIVAALSVTIVSCRNNNRGNEASPTNMETGDAQALAELEKTGSDLSKPHLVDFYLYFPNREDAEEIAKTLRNEGYQVTVRLGADNVNWLCLARKAIIPSHQTMTSIRAHFEMLVKPKNGEYDGWEAAVAQ